MIFLFDAQAKRREAIFSRPRSARRQSVASRVAQHMKRRYSAAWRASHPRAQHPSAPIARAALLRGVVFAVLAAF